MPTFYLLKVFLKCLLGCWGFVLLLRRISLSCPSFFESALRISSGVLGFSATSLRTSSSSSFESVLRMSSGVLGFCAAARRTLPTLHLLKVFLKCLLECWDFFLLPYADITHASSFSESVLKMSSGALGFCAAASADIIILSSFFESALRISSGALGFCGCCFADILIFLF